MHEMYAKDISKKVGSIYKIKQEKKVFYRSSRRMPYFQFIPITPENPAGLPVLCRRKYLPLEKLLAAKDISKKVGSIYKIKQEKKVFYRSSTLPYGYKMDQAGGTDP